MKIFTTKIALIICLIGLGFTTLAQSPTVGLMHYSPDVTDGYMLFTPERNAQTYLVDPCGEVVNSWTFSEEPGLTCYLLDNGNLLRAGKDSIEIRDWDNNLVWSYAVSDSGFRQHHDIEPLPNGNILMVVTGLYADTTILAEGRMPALVSGDIKLDQVIELEPVGTHDANVVWQWNFIDHLIQDFDSTKENYGVVEDHPELLDINYDNGNNFDWTHVNSIDYNADLDQIIMSARHTDEIYIIDHSTTTAEAASHAGGASGKGGDFLWRWGNPLVYRQGQSFNQKLFGQHDAKWVPAGYADEGKISVFNNGGNGVDLESMVHLIEPEIVGGNYTMNGNLFLPSDFDFSWGGMLLGHVLFEDKKSGCHTLPNGNFMITESGFGLSTEIQKDGTVLWCYKNPTYNNGAVYNQFDSPSLSQNGIFRGEKYMPDFPGFVGKDLTSTGPIENVNANSDYCVLLQGIEDLEYTSIEMVNPVTDGTIQFSESITANAIWISDVEGREVYREDKFTGSQLNVQLTPGVYLLQYTNDRQLASRKIIVL